ncbi:tyrosine-type recombinase/integrase [Terrarubrum flagellatum]|uniref:tyrosine-type recombinase/integrase n=1 Tax=Terrirubrum flagellatum TaxID=2895980 RepID=UPI00314557F5
MKPSFLRFAFWPVPYRKAWDRAFQTTEDIFGDSGPAAHLSGGSRRTLLYALGTYLGFLKSNASQVFGLTPPQIVTADLAREYSQALEPSHRLQSVGIRLRGLRHACRSMYPNENWDFLLRIASRYQHAGVKRHRFALDIAEISAESIRQLDRLRLLPPTKLLSLEYRDWLIVALVCEMPLRRRNIAQIMIDKHLRRSGTRWSLFFEGSETKNHEPIEGPLPIYLSDLIDDYLARWRPLIPGASKHAGLWASSKGVPIKAGKVFEIVKLRTGHPPHEFRKGAGSFHARHGDVAIAKDLLAHADQRTTEMHYVERDTFRAARKLQEVLRRQRERAAPSSSP